MVLAALTVLQMVMAVLITQWSAGLFNALEQHSMPGLLRQAGLLVLLFFADMALTGWHLVVKRNLTISWRDWLTDTGVNGVNGIAGPKFEYYSLVIQAAIAGIGVAILPDFLVREEIQSGALMVAYAHRMRCEDAYFVVYPKRFDENINVQAFVGWLRDEARSYIESSP